MATKSIVDIEINDTAFKRYQETFRKYQDLLKAQPAQWKTISAGMLASQKILQQHLDLTKKISENENRMEQIGDRQARTWRDMARSTRTFASNIQSATTALLKWAGVTTAISGLLGAGGLFGIDRLAVAAASQRRSASGLGITPGQSQAFSLNYGRVVNTEAVLGGVNTSLTDASQRSHLIRAGFTEQELAGKNAAQVSAELIEKLKRRADTTPTNMLGDLVRALGLESLGIDEQTLRRLKDRPASEIAGYRKDFERDQKTLDISSPAQRAWENLKVQLERAALMIENTFIKVLTPLTPNLEKLSAAFADLVQKLLGGEAGKSLIDGIAKGLGSLADTLTSPEFHKSIHQFADDIVSAAKAIHHWAKWIGDKWDDSQGHVTPLPHNPDGSPQGGILEWLKKQISYGSSSPDSFSGVNGLGGVARIIQAAYRVPGGSAAPTGGGGGSPSGGGLPGSGGGVTPRGGSTFASLEAANGLPGGLLDAVWNAESGRGRNMLSSAGAQGHFQFMPGTWRRYGGGGSPYDLGQSSTAAAHYFKDLLARFGGDIQKAVAGYNWGEGNVEKDIRRWGDRWKEHLPRETQQYLDKVLGRGTGGVAPAVPGRGGGGAVWARIEINNNTGGSAIVTASQLAT